MADAFSDYLGVTPPPVQAAAPAALPPMPKMGFMDVLAGAFGAGPDKIGAYQKGLDTSSQYRLRSAQTESALAEADKRRGDALRQTQVNDLVTRANSDPNFQPTVSDLLTLSTGAGDFTTGRLHEQEHGFRGGVADIATPQPQRLANMEAISGKPVERYYQSGTGMQASQIDPAAPPVVTPVGQAQINNYNEKSQGGFTIGGVRYNADGTLAVDVGMAARNAATVAGAVAGAREQVKATTPIKLPAAVQKGVSDNAALLQRIRNAKQMVKDNPNSFGLKYALGDEVNQRMDPAGVGARAAVADLSSVTIHERSGANVTAKEFPRLSPFIPAATNTSKAIITKLEQMEAAVLDEQEAIGAMYAQQPTAPATPGAPVAPGALPPPTNSKGWKLKKRTNNGVVEYGYLGPNGEVEMVQ
jgi:hypothetical protein